MARTMWDGKRRRNGKPNPVTLVAIVLVRKSAVQPFELFRREETEHDYESGDDPNQAQRDVHNGVSRGHVILRGWRFGANMSACFAPKSWMLVACLPVISSIPFVTRPYPL